MADFRRFFYALAVVALLAGFTIPVSAQQQTFPCTASGVPSHLRQEGFTELVGDLTLFCTGGIPTPEGQTVPPVDIVLTLNTNLTSRLLTSNGVWNEALLIIDEPHSAVRPSRPLLNCGAPGAPDTGSSGPGRCSIISNGDPTMTYDGTRFVRDMSECSGSYSLENYGCGRPNVFQGQTGSTLFSSPNNSVTFAGVPIDPPGSVGSRVLRFTNIRADAHDAGSNGQFILSPVQIQIVINGNTGMTITNNPTQTVGYVQQGLVVGGNGHGKTFLQCEPQDEAEIPNTFVTFTEGFETSFKARNISQIIDDGDFSTSGNGTLQPGNSYWTWNGTYNDPGDINQNVPQAVYFTEGGFLYPGDDDHDGTDVLDDPSPNPPLGVGTVAVSATHQGFTTHSTGISGAGRANQGTRLAMRVSGIPTGATVEVPTEVPLIGGCFFPIVGGVPSQNAVCNASLESGALMLVDGNDPNGAGGVLDFGSTTIAAGNGDLIVFEVVFADPFQLEQAKIPFFVSFPNTVQTNQQAIVTGAGFAPFYSGQAPTLASFTLPIPRFAPNTSAPNVNLFIIDQCTCNLLFPFVVSAGGFDTGVAIANTSLDPGPTFGFGANQQAGPVEFWYYGTQNGGPPPGTQCTNTTTAGACPGTQNLVPAGQVLLYALSTGSAAWGLDNRAAGFSGYMIAQTQFQYCHAFAYISALGAGPLTTGISEGYLGLLLDNNAFNCQGELADPTDNFGLCRTGQQGENLVH